MENIAKLIYAASESSADLRYGYGFSDATIVAGGRDGAEMGHSLITGGRDNFLPGSPLWWISSREWLRQAIGAI